MHGLETGVKQPVLEWELNVNLEIINIPKPMNRKLSFSAGCLFELALLVLAWIWGLLFHRSALLDLHWSLTSALIGIVAAIPPFLFFLWTLNTNIHAFSRHKQLMESLLRPLFGNWSVLQLFTISLIAGIGVKSHWL